MKMHNDDIMLRLRKEREHTQQLLDESTGRLREGMHMVLHPSDIGKGRNANISAWVSRGISIYQGIRMGLIVIGAMQTLFGHKRRKSKR